MTTSRAVLLAINLIGGAAVIGSYVVGLGNWGEDAVSPPAISRLWGGVPAGLRGVYGASMLLAAAGYLLFFYHVVIRMDPTRASIPGGFSIVAFAAPFAIILAPSAVWMSLTLRYAEAPTPQLWLALRLALALVAFGSLAMLAMLASLKVSAPDQFWWPATIGAAVFAFHTLFLDALLWPALFRT
jgi:hypothetical protein